MSNGAEQFLGRQLVNMTQALQGLVNESTEMLLALQDMKTAIESTIPKFAITSDNLKHNVGSFGSIAPNFETLKQVVPFVSGTIKIKITATSTAATYIGLTVNGVLVTRQPQPTTSTVTEHIVNVLEGDIIKVKNDSASGTISATKFNIYYDLIEKPNISY